MDYFVLGTLSSSLVLFNIRVIFYSISYYNLVLDTVLIKGQKSLRLAWEYIEYRNSI